MAGWVGVIAAPTSWAPCFRIIPSRFPPVQLFERVTDPADLEAVFQLESMTNPRVRDEVGELEFIPPEERVSGPGAGYVMAAFTHVNPLGSRFSDGSYGVYYAAFDLETAIAETIHHQVKYLTFTGEPAQDLDMRVLMADLAAELIDLHGTGRKELLHPLNYGPAQSFAIEVRGLGHDGILYPSVRNFGGECAAAFRPKCISNCRQSRHLSYPWDGVTIRRELITEKSRLVDECRTEKAPGEGASKSRDEMAKSLPTKALKNPQARKRKLHQGIQARKGKK